MQALSPARANFAQTAIVSLATLAAVALAATVLAYWTWVWVAPRPAPRVEPVPDTGPGMSSAARLFGTAQRESGAAPPTGIAVKLLGVVAATHGRRGYAIMQIEGREILAVGEGADAAPGIRVAEVHPEHVILSRNGVRESLAWPQKKQGAETAGGRVDK